MKKTIVISMLALTTAFNAQIKVFPGGLQSYGSTTSPAGSVKHHFMGDFVVAEAGNTTSGCAFIKANGSTNASSVSRPDFSWLGDATTGIFHPGSSLIGLTVSGGEKFRFNITGQILSSASQAAGTPAYSWTVDPNTGIFNAAADVIGFATGGYERARINAGGQIVSSSTAYSASTPEFSWNTESGTGMYHAASNAIGFTIGSSEKVRIGTNSFLIGSTTDNVGRLAVTAATDKMAIQSWSNYTWDGGTHEQVNVNRDATHAYMLYNTSTGSPVLKYHLSGAGDVWVHATTTWSDRNLKENIDSLQNSLDKIKQLKGVKYNFKASFIGNGPIKTELGLIAQDVEQILPEVVMTDFNGTKGIVYHNIIPVLIEAIKELDKKNTQLESAINDCCSKAGSKTNDRSIKNDDDASINQDAKSYMNQNKPNPFNKETVIEYNIIESGTASILLFDMNGKLLKTIPVKIPGKGSITISAADLQPGMYYYSLIVNDTEVDTKKMILTQ